MRFTAQSPYIPHFVTDHGIFGLEVSIMGMSQKMLVFVACIFLDR